MLFIIGVLIVIAIIVWLVKELVFPSQRKNIEGKHVVITGGSSGIGKAVAMLAAKMGAHVTIIARDVQKLEASRNDIMSACKNRDSQRIEYLSLDISKDYETIEKSFLDIEKTMGPIYMLVNCAGMAICGKIEDTTIETLNWIINLNFMGTYYCTKAVIPRMKSAKDGIFGYSAYCSSKFALRGLSESLAMEVNPHNVSVTLCLPPDTDTPGFAVEEQSKPLETKLISESAGLVKADVVAKQLIADACAGRFFSTVGFEGFMLTTLSAGMSPVSSLAELFLQFLTMGLMRVVGACYLFSFQKIIKNCMDIRDKNKKSE
ncbi:Similar to KDSR: 3-ketodihydrosphingosine reductase (Homo sapiens) [Cotesia congregata]|uniref:3-dehydrosphinganine reductase n=1 Tax=Cotesia congregata TaxID=51543 RepID=A0A8J2HGT4_COTCN|nr:Similar to KDSR: 3-ketodihydrosphingosine reductase (Homo sapiens) [Cotesia congregata]